mmetsp:Transcript_50014/g.98813  ORF Transcript_50014/g.98813 Transcript_50014/m.98813 type:complete len:442 (+) Transcript_50014:103-1428(+)
MAATSKPVLGTSLDDDKVSLKGERRMKTIPTKKVGKRTTLITVKAASKVATDEHLSFYIVSRLSGLVLVLSSPLSTRSDDDSFQDSNPVTLAMREEGELHQLWSLTITGHLKNEASLYVLGAVGKKRQARVSAMPLKIDEPSQIWNLNARGELINGNGGLLTIRRGNTATDEMQISITRRQNNDSQTWTFSTAESADIGGAAEACLAINSLSPCAEPDPVLVAGRGRSVSFDLSLLLGEVLSLPKPIQVMALVVYRKHSAENLVQMLARSKADSPPETDPWWQEHLVQMHITSSLSDTKATLTLVLEGTRERLGNACRGETRVYKRPLFYFHPKRNWKRPILEHALCKGFGPEGEGYTTTKDRHGQDIKVILRPPFVAEEEIPASEPPAVRVLFTYVFRNPGRGVLKSTLRFCSRFRVLFQAHEREEYGKFEIKPALAGLL